MSSYFAVKSSLGCEPKSLHSLSKQVILLAFEEAIGYMCSTEVLDKDGVSAAVRCSKRIQLKAFFAGFCCSYYFSIHITEFISGYLN